MASGIPGSASQAKFGGDRQPLGMELGIGDYWQAASVPGTFSPLLILLPNHSLVLFQYDNRHVPQQVWSNGGEFTNAHMAIFQADGNFVVYEPDGGGGIQPVSTTDTQNNPNAVMFLFETGDATDRQAFFQIQGHPGGDIIWDSRVNSMRHINH
jgi:hypothetical protein